MVHVRFACPGCAQEIRMHRPGPAEWQCSGCDQLLRLPAALAGAELAACPLCGNAELYKKKDFPHWLGLTILTIACAAFFVAQNLYHPWIAWSVLIGSALLDGGLYLWVGDAIVCYRCGASFHGLEPSETHRPFELGVAERYRQERLRREQLEREQARI